MTSQISPQLITIPASPSLNNHPTGLGSEQKKKIASILVHLQLLLDQSRSAEDRGNRPILVSLIKESGIQIDALNNVVDDIERQSTSTQGSIIAAINSISVQFNVFVPIEPSPRVTNCHTPSPLLANCHTPSPLLAANFK